MSTRLSSGLTAVAVLGLSLTLAAPAQAAPNLTVNGSAFGASVTLGGNDVVGPLPTVTLPADGTAQTASSVAVPLTPLVTAGVLNASTSGDPVTGTSTALGSVADVDLLPGVAGLPSGLSADLVEATCEATPTGATGSSRFVALATGGTPYVGTPGPNTTISVPGVATVVLNEQVANPDGSLTVTALRVTLLTQVVVKLGSATCGPNVAAPPINAFPTSGLPIVGGLVAATVLGAVVLRRRRDGQLV